MIDPRSITVRRADEEDAIAIAAVLDQAFRPYRSLYTAPAYAATTPDAGGVRARMAEGPAWVATMSAATLGTAAAVTRADALYVRGMAVAPAARGLGLGRRLLEAIEHHGRSQRGTSRLILSTTPFLEAAIRLYTRAGFERTDAGPHDLFGTPLFTMEKPL